MSACPVVRIKPAHPSQGDYILINESDFDATKHELHVAPPPVVVPPPPLPPPPGAPDPLAKLRPDWREGMKTAELRSLAAAVSGRMPENRDQAVQMIAAKLAAK